MNGRAGSARLDLNRSPRVSVIALVSCQRGSQRLAACTIWPRHKVSCVATREGGVSMESVVARPDAQVAPARVAGSAPRAERAPTGVRRPHMWGVGLLAGAAAALYLSIGALAY